jgi:hypothetical protein
MDLPDYDAARGAADTLGAGHTTQHRCTDGRYYGPREWADCPTSTAVRTLVNTLADARALPHTACHDDTAVHAVAQAMVTHPDGGAVLLAYLDPVQRSWWISKARLAMEAQAALLDPDAVTA